MANVLYRLARFAAQKAWVVITAWVLVLIVAATAMTQFSGTLSSSVSLEGTESQEVIDRLKDSLPEVSRGQGQVVIHNPNGPFSDSEIAAIESALTAAMKIQGIATVVNPFEVSADRDLQGDELAQASDNLEEGELELSDAAAEIETGKDQLTQSQEDLDAQAAELATQRKSLENSLEEIESAIATAKLAGAPASQQEQLLKNKATVLASLEQVEQGEKKVAAGQAQLDQKSEDLKEAELTLESEVLKFENAEQEVQTANRLMVLTEGYKTLSENGDTAIVTVQFTVPTNAVEKSTTKAVIELFSELRSESLEVEFSQALSSERGGVMGPGEIIGLIIAAIILLVMLGSFVAAGLPILTAVLGVAIAVSIILALSGSIEMNSSTQNLAVMLGLAVGIDYSLFLLNRHRRQLKAGMDLHDSIGLAAGTSGNAVTFAGMTVIIALVALNLTGISFLGLMGTMGALAIALAVMLALTFIPAILSLVGFRVLSSKERAAIPKANSSKKLVNAKVEDKQGIVTRRPLLASIAVIALLGIVSIPAPEMRLGLPDGSSEPLDSTTYKSFALVSENFGEGANGLITTVVSMPNAVSEQTLSSLQADLGERFFELENVMAVLPAAVSADSKTLLFQVIPDFGPASLETEELVFDLRGLSDEISADFGADLGITGITASNIDISQILGAALPTYLGSVLILSLLLLILVFRSILLPLLATAGFLLTTVATFGAVVAVYQWGWLGWIFGVHDPGPILNFLPTILIGVLFGLAMDYQLFLASGMREAYVHGKDPRASINHGLALSRSVVIAAALIMVTVFGGFAFSHNTLIRPIGFGLAIGVLIDAFLIRLILVPSLMSLFGKYIWWIPGWLDKVLPNVDVEGSALESPKGKVTSGTSKAKPKAKA
jgi:putative drug exporter of the RND superfamily